MLVSLFADASWCPDQKVGGWGVWIKSLRGKFSQGGSFKISFAASHEAELCAVANGLKISIIKGIAESGDTILIQTDCIRVLEILNKHNLKLSNIERDALKVILDSRLANKLKLKFKHVKGHTDGGQPRLWVNTECDRLAREGMQAARRK